MRYGSVCSGIEAASVAWEPLGWAPAWFSEVAPFPSRVLKHRFPKVENHGSLIGLSNRLAGDDRNIDILVGGTPCQGFSVAGLRSGLAGESGNLALEFARLAQALRPRWLLWENVPGVLSLPDNAFGCLLGALSELGYGLAWRVLDAQFFRVAQRRERVFLVGSLGGAAAAGAVLFEPEGVRRNPPTRGEAREDVAGTLGRGAGGRRLDLDGHGAYIPERERALTASSQRLDSETETFLAFDPTQVTHPDNRSSCRGDVSPSLAKGARPPHIAFCVTGEVTHSLRSVGADASEDGTGRGTPIVSTSARVRRLTPRECERLQGFPDDWTAIDGAKDTPRYAALGNSMAVPCMRWIGQRIFMVDEILKEAA